MCPGLKDDLQAVNNVLKTGVSAIELHRLNVDIEALQETILPDSGYMNKEHHTFFCQGKYLEETREHGLGFAVRNTLLSMIERIILRLVENGQSLLELCCYHDLCVNNTFFQNKPYHRVSWRHPGHITGSS